jgi:DNA polymerase III subunit epsilon
MSVSATLPQNRSNARGQDAGDDDNDEAASRQFICATVEQGMLLQTRISLVRDPTGRTSGYVLTFADVGHELEQLAIRDGLLREVAMDWRRPLANLRAATEMLTENDDILPDDRKVFEEIIAKEVQTLGERFSEVTKRHDRLAAGPWPMADIYSLDLFRTIAKHLNDTAGIRVTPTGIPTWLHADGHSLMLALEHLIRAISGKAATQALDLEARLKDQYSYVEIIWDGAALPLAVIDSWLNEPLKGAIANRTILQIVEQHGGELWGQALPDGRACLRLPLRTAARISRPKSVARSAPRPEFYDLELFNVVDSALEDVPLRKINFVVFDTETTGLRPVEGDELISIGAVRVVNGRILTSETFERLINPGRAIPKVSTEIHGITDAAVEGKPPAEVVLPQFKSFVGDSVLVAYNAAFDMKFLELKEARAGVTFDNPVLDAQLLSIYLQPELAEHSLGSIAHQLGVEVVARHTAVGDAITTAAVLVKLLDLLQAKGIETFGQAVKISSRMMESRKRMFNA